MTLPRRFKEVFSTGEVARFCRASPRVVQKWFNEGQLEGYIFPGGRGLDRRFTRESLIRFLKKNNMDLMGLEDELLYKVLLVGVVRGFSGRLKAALSDKTRYRVESAADPFHAGVTAVELKPDAVIIDFEPGRRESLALASSVRGSRATQDATIVGLAGEDEEEDLNGLVIRHGFTVVYQKPVAVEKVVQRLEAHLTALKDS